MEVGRERFVLAEVPGLIEHAHLGRGLGHDFLRHIMRTRILIHLISADSDTPVDDMMRVNNELVCFDATLAAKPQIVAVNKIDLPRVKDRLNGILSDFRSAGIKAHFISALTGQSVEELMAVAANLLRKSAAEEGSVKEPPKVFRPQPKGSGITVSREGGVFVVSAPGLERLFASTGVSTIQLHAQLKQRLARMGVNKVLVKAGVKPGDRIKCGHLEWEW